MEKERKFTNQYEESIFRRYYNWNKLLEEKEICQKGESTLYITCEACGGGGCGR